MSALASLERFGEEDFIFIELRLGAQSSYELLSTLRDPMQVRQP